MFVRTRLRRLNGRRNYSFALPFRSGETPPTKNGTALSLGEALSVIMKLYRSNACTVTAGPDQIKLDSIQSVKPWILEFRFRVWHEKVCKAFLLHSSLSVAVSVFGSYPCKRPPNQEEHNTRRKEIEART